jgi:hypothetical protein
VQEIMQCMSCYAASVYLLYFDASDTAAPRSASRIMQVFPAPTPRELNPAVPEEVRSLFHEAAVSEVHGALRAAAVMYRSSVEAMCKDLDVSGRDVFTKIEALIDKGLDRTVVDDLHEARMLGNDSIHDGLAYSADEVADVAGLIEEAFNVLYVQPAERRVVVTGGPSFQIHGAQGTPGAGHLVQDRQRQPVQPPSTTC